MHYGVQNPAPLFQELLQETDLQVPDCQGGDLSSRQKEEKNVFGLFHFFCIVVCWAEMDEGISCSYINLMYMLMLVSGVDCNWTYIQCMDQFSSFLLLMYGVLDEIVQRNILKRTGIKVGLEIALKAHPKMETDESVSSQTQTLQWSIL